MCQNSVWFYKILILVWKNRICVITCDADTGCKQLTPNRLLHYCCPEGKAGNHQHSIRQQSHSDWWQLVKAEKIAAWVHLTKPTTGLTSTSELLPAQSCKCTGCTSNAYMCWKHTCVRAHAQKHKMEKITLGNECQISYTLQAVWIANKLLKGPAQLNMMCLGSHTHVCACTHTDTHTHTQWFSCL